MKKLSAKAALGYGVGSFSEASFYQFVNTFYLIFLTSVAGIAPGMAGTIVSLTILADAVGTVFIGHASDNLRCRFGRRRPLLLFSTIFNPLIFTLCFITLDQSREFQFTYYLIAGALFWISYSLFYIPYSALGAEITADYNERIRLRSVSRMFSVAGSCLATAVPLTVIEMMTARGASEQGAWLFFCILFAVTLGLLMLVCWNNTRGFEKPPLDPREKIRPALILKDFWQIMKLRVMYLLVSSKVAFMTAYTFYTGAMLFFLRFNLGLTGRTISAIYLFTNALSLLFTPLILKLAVRFDKKKQMAMAFFIAGAGGMLLSLVRIESLGPALIWISLFSFANSTYWQLSNAMFYDITEVDEMANGAKREGSITSLQCLWGTLTSAAAFQAVGQFLKISGFDSSALPQHQEALAGIAKIFVFYPSTGLMIASLLLFYYPMDRRNFELLKEAMERKKKNLDYGEYERIIRKLV